MKRSYTSSPDIKEDPVTPPPTTPKRSKASASRTETPSPSKTGSGVNTNGEWTADKREAVMEKIITAGVKASNFDDLALEFELSKKQLVNQFSLGRPSSLRAKAAKAVRGEA